MSDKPQLLWTDDEGPGRFLYAEMRLKSEGWDVTWARSVEEAATLLSTKRYDALVLDQTLPVEQDSRDTSVWGGCTLYRWLRGHPVAAGAPASLVAPPLPPRPDNQEIPVAIVSAYRHDDVEQAIFDATPASAQLTWIGKPLEEGLLRRALRSRKPAS